MKSIYLAGPMTGYKDHNFPLFESESARLRALGYHVISPHEIKPNTTMSWVDCLKADIPALITCDTIALLPNWEQSRGARLEHHIAAALEFEVTLSAAITQQRGVSNASDQTSGAMPS